MNNSRGEVTIQLAGEERTMRPTFEAIAGIERDLNTNILPLLKKISVGDIGIKNAAIIIFHGLKGAGDTRLNLNQVGEAVMQSGLNEVSNHIAEFLVTALEGVEGLGKRKEAAEPARAES